MPRSIWNGVISFGMVSIPVKLYSATESKDISFHQLHSTCETRIKYQKWCPQCEEVVDQDDIERGYEYARGHYVVLDDEDFEQLPLPSRHTIDVSAFVESEQIDPVYYEKTYYLEPDEAAIRPFTLFMKALQDMGMVGIAAITLRNKERLCALRPLGGTLLIDTLLYPDEVRVSADTDLPKVKVSEKELAMAEHLIKLMKQDFDPSQYEDHYRAALKKLIEAKLDGKEITVSAERPSTKVIDLMDALRVSVENIKSKGSASLEDTSDQISGQIKRSAHRAADQSDEKSEEGEETQKPKRKPARSNSTKKGEDGESGSPEHSSKRNSAAKHESASATKRSSSTSEHKRKRKESA